MQRTALAFLTLTCAASAAVAQAPVLTAQPSTRATTTVTLAGPRGSNLQPKTISIDYGQPHLRGRTLAAVVPMDEVWRLGANASTTLETGVDLMIGSQHVPAGKYSLYAMPSASGWKLIINRNTGQWGTDYVADQDLARVDLRRTELAQPVESFSMWLIPQNPQTGKASGELRFAWGRSLLSTTWMVH